MKRKKAVTLERGNPVIGGVIGGSVCLMLCFALSGIFAWLIVCEYLEQTMMNYAALLVVLLSGFVGGCIGVMKSNKKPIVAILVSISVVMAVLLLLTAVCLGGKYSGIWVGFLILSAGNFAALFILVNKRHKRGGRGRPYR